jgi:hypothetical protein
MCKINEKNYNIWLSSKCCFHDHESKMLIFLVKLDESPLFAITQCLEQALSATVGLVPLLFP